MRILIAAMVTMIGLSGGATMGAEQLPGCSILDRPPGAPKQPEDTVLLDNCAKQTKMQLALALSERGTERAFADEDKIARIVHRIRSSSGYFNDSGRISKDDLEYLLNSLMSWKSLAIHFGDDLKIPAKEQDAMLGKALDLPISLAPKNGPVATAK